MNVNNLKLGALGGLVGGLVFGAMMANMGMLPMIGKMVGQPTATTGFLVHLLNSAIIGAVFAVLFGHMISGASQGLGYGLGYGVAWWLLGPPDTDAAFSRHGFRRELDDGSRRKNAAQFVRTHCLRDGVGGDLFPDQTRMHGLCEVKVEWKER